MDYLPTKEEIENFNKFKSSYKKMIEQGHLKLVEDDKLCTENFKINKAIPLTDFGKEFLKGSDSIKTDLKNDIGSY